MKINIANNFIKRVQQLSTKVSIDHQRHTIFQHLRQNNYPSALINRLIHHSSNQHTIQHASPQHSTSTRARLLPAASNIARPTDTQHISPTTSPPDQLSTIRTDQGSHNSNREELQYRSMPNIPTLTSAVSAVLKVDYPNVRIAPRIVKTTQTLLQPVKDRVIPNQHHNVIYRIPCSNCEQVYIGMTTNNLKTRLSGHKSNINKLAEVLQTTQHIQAKTALIQHMVDHQHMFNLADTKIIDRSYRSSALPMLEMCHISNTSNAVNYRTDVEGLHTTYAGILHTLRANSSRRERSQNNNHNQTQQSTDE